MMEPGLFFHDKSTSSIGVSYLKLNNKKTLESVIRWYSMEYLYQVNTAYNNNLYKLLCCANKIVYEDDAVIHQLT